MNPLFPLTSPASFIRLWIHGWLRWNRSLRLCHGGGYAFDAAYYRDLLSIDSRPVDSAKVSPFLRPTTSATPYSGWLSDESILFAESQPTDEMTTPGCLAYWSKNAFISELLKLVLTWENSPEFCGS
ncbi:unnamed protein product [Echinostoma caproni]|uniref:Uncharacterized protein n=1 Tax=Echinostoma caproni TaxID=27848 RepID=A0A183BFE7_9TREM|nr:unnamed protein product [Echinostoma caproni]